MSAIDDFEKTLSRKSKPAHALWRPVDLHNHSPESRDYSGNKGSALEDAARHLSATDVDIVMFTDHHTLPDRAFTEQVQRRSGKTVLRGTELNIFVDAWSKPPVKVDKQAFFHLLVGFAPDVDADYWFKHLNEKCGGRSRAVSGTQIQGLTSPMEKICALLKETEALVIPAHLHKHRDAFKSRSIDDIYTDEQFLELARTHFTALEVTDPRTAEFFDGKHAETQMLHKSCIRSSDAHDVTRIGERVAYVQMEEPTFGELKAGLEIPARVRLERPELPPSYIVGVNITGQFFEDLWLTFSPNCNALIGVKGSGKTSLLECLRFALGGLVPESRREEVESHLSHILGQSGRVRVLVRREDGAKLLVERAIARPEVYQLVFEDNRCEQVQNPDALMFTSFILGWHEIEQAATDAAIRQAYLDTIADREKIRQLQEAADDRMAQIRSLHEQVTNSYASYRSLSSQVTGLQELRSGLQELTDANLIQLKNDYERAHRHKDALERLETWLQDQKNNTLDLRALEVAPELPTLGEDSPISEFAAQGAEVLTSLHSHAQRFAESHREEVRQHASAFAEKMPDMRLAFECFAHRYDTAVSELSDEKRRLLEAHRQVLDQTRSLPELEQHMNEESGKLDVILRRLSDLCNEIADALDSQTELRKSKVSILASELIDYGVQLEVAPMSRLAAFENLVSKNPDGANVYGELNARFSQSERHHRRLASAYEDARKNLAEGFPLLLSSLPFGVYLGAFEEDDLRISFDVAQGGGDYRPIDQLSAGQRCTAVFPLLLKLQKGPLVVDQPEDNLDNRHIADAIAPALMEDKRRRQVAFTSHNANLVVLTDAEQIVMFESDGRRGDVHKRGFLCRRESRITDHVIAILDGGPAALQLRYQKYGVEAA